MNDVQAAAFLSLVFDLIRLDSRKIAAQRYHERSICLQSRLVKLIFPASSGIRNSCTD